MDATHIRDLLSDEDAVSPVIGVILMVAITVILAAVIGTFVLGLGDQVTSSQAPTANFDFDYNPSGNSGKGAVTITHGGGDSIESARLSFAASGFTATTDHGGSAFPSEVKAGSSATVVGYDGGNQTMEEGDTLRVVWTSEGGGSSQTLASYDIPSSA